MPQCISEWFFSLSLPKAGGDSPLTPNIHCENLVELLEVKFTKFLRAPYHWVPLKFVSLRPVHTEPSAIHQLQFRFPSRAQILPEVWAPGFLFCKCNSLYSPFGLSNFGDSSFACDFTFLINIFKSCGFYSLFSLIIRIEQCLPASYMLDQKPDAQHCFILFIITYLCL